MKHIIDISRWPASAAILKWGALLGYHPTTLYRYYSTGRLKGTKQLNGRVTITKEAICECFNIQAKELTNSK
jgi:predicted site-specific integrase-resolvase